LRCGPVGASSIEGGSDNDGGQAADAWAEWRSVPLSRKVVVSVLGGVAAASVLWALDGWIFNEPDWSAGKFALTAAVWTAMSPIIRWLGARHGRP
ncbi:MAG TPA: hypothetical protein VLB67_16290, partial [Acidimicrobiia bacterium]|nr:hypothetical protein [Acidimicrobiia bacterium]